MIDPARTTLRALRGAPLSILFALFIEGSPLLKKHMETLTGYNSDTVQKGVEVLLALGLIAPSGSAWALTTAAWQLPLPFDMSKQQDFSLRSPVLFDESANIDTPGTSPKKSDSANPVVVVNSTDKLTEILPLLHRDASPKKSDSGVAGQQEAHLESLRAVQNDVNGELRKDLVRVMRVFSIFPNVASRLAERIVEGDLQISPIQIIGLGYWLKQESGVRNVGGTLTWHIETGTLPAEKYMPPVNNLDDALKWLANQQTTLTPKSTDRSRYLKYLDDIQGNEKEEPGQCSEEDDL